MQIQEDDKWLKYSQMNKEHFSGQFLGFTLISSLISHPLAVLAVRQQAGSSVTGDSFKKGNIVNVLRQSYKSVGLKGLYRGWLPLAGLGVPSNFMYISVMEMSREYFQSKYRSALPTWSPYSIDLLQAISSSIVANVISIVPFVPGEVLSSRLMIQGKEGLSTIEMTRHMYKEQGIRTFFKGFNASLLVGIVLSSAWWSTYSSVKRYTQNRNDYSQYSVAYDGLAGFSAGMVSAAVAHPFDTVKTRIMTAFDTTTANSTTRISGNNAVIQSVEMECKRFLPTLIDTVKQQGVRRLFKGLSAVLYQSALGSSVFALCYELIKRKSTPSI